ncbi:MAG: type I restriction-modification system subunit M N-terminal domain-containing protein [Betaproteobacteria bacterium]|nr:type I restriction-modification system subunit M N-terminal domain-containing protein [Betaproteobacteria bacterium]
MTNAEFKKLLWDAAVKLRGSLSAAEYKYPVLGLVFLKYVSDAFDAQADVIRARAANPARDEYVDDPPCAANSSSSGCRTNRSSRPTTSSGSRRTRAIPSCSPRPSKQASRTNSMPRWPRSRSRTPSSVACCTATSGAWRSTPARSAICWGSLPRCTLTPVIWIEIGGICGNKKAPRGNARLEWSAKHEVGGSIPPAAPSYALRQGRQACGSGDKTGTVCPATAAQLGDNLGTIPGQFGMKKARFSVGTRF